SPWIIERLERKIGEGALDPLYLFDVIAAGARRDTELKLGTLLKAKQQCQQHATRRRNLLGYRFVVACNELRRARLAAKRRSTLPSVAVSANRAVRELLASAVDAFKPDAHPLLSYLSNYRDRCRLPDRVGRSPHQ